MCKIFVRHQIVCLNGALDIFTMNANGDAHDHLLRSFGNLSVDAKKVGSFQRLEAKVLIVEIPVIDDCRVQLLRMFHHSIVCLFGDHGTMLVVLRVHVIV